jgi:hypothetical protein
MFLFTILLEATSSGSPIRFSVTIPCSANLLAESAQHQKHSNTFESWKGFPIIYDRVVRKFLQQSIATD